MKQSLRQLFLRLRRDDAGMVEASSYILIVVLIGIEEVDVELVVSSVRDGISGERELYKHTMLTRGVCARATLTALTSHAVRIHAAPGSRDG